jgi:hypothetical protein
VLGVLYDAHRPLTATKAAAGTAWPGARTYGLRRTRRLLRELEAAGFAERRQGRWHWLRWP